MYSQAAPDVDAGIVGQDATNDELLTDDELSALASPTIGSRPFLRDNSMLRLTKGRLPFWLAGQENWVYLLLLLAAALGVWWHFKKK